MILVVYLGHVSLFYPEAVFFSLNQFLWGEHLKLPNCETSETKWCTSIVARVLRSLLPRNTKTSM